MSNQQWLVDGQPGRVSGMQALRHSQISSKVLNGGTIEAGASDLEIAITIPGGAATPDIADGVVAFFLPTNEFGVRSQVAASQLFRGMTGDLLEIGAVSLTGDSFRRIMIINKADLSDCSGLGWGFEYTGGVRTLQCIRMLNGVVVGTDDDPAETADYAVFQMESGHRQVIRWGFTTSYDTPDFIGHTADATAFGGVVLTDTLPNLFVVMWGGRTDSTAGPITHTTKARMERLNSFSLGPNSI